MRQHLAVQEVGLRMVKELQVLVLYLEQQQEQEVIMAKALVQPLILVCLPLPVRVV
jgi:hypothetical protein